MSRRGKLVLVPTVKLISPKTNSFKPRSTATADAHPANPAPQHVLQHDDAEAPEVRLGQVQLQAGSVGAGEHLRGHVGRAAATLWRNSAHSLGRSTQWQLVNPQPLAAWPLPPGSGGVGKGKKREFWCLLLPGSNIILLLFTYYTSFWR